MGRIRTKTVYEACSGADGCLLSGGGLLGSSSMFFFRVSIDFGGPLCLVSCSGPGAAITMIEHLP